MLTNDLTTLFLRDLKHVREELNAYKDEGKLWELRGEVKNTAGNLALHIAGNLLYFIGSVLGNTGYERDRNAEFADKNVKRTEIIMQLEQAADVIKSTLPAIKEDALTATYPLKVFEKDITTRIFLLHLLGHLNYHLGQINYHRRLLTE